MGKWFNQAEEIEKLRAEVRRQAATINALRTQIANAGLTLDYDPYDVSAEERELVLNGRPIEAIKQYRERTGADLREAKQAIDSVKA